MIRPQSIVPPVMPVIRRALPADVRAVAAIETESFGDPWDQEVFAEALSYFPTTYFVAVIDGAIVGFVVGALEDTGENIYGHICNIAVSPPYRHRGIGGLIVSRVENQFALELATGVQLEVRVSNKTAQRFYKKRGYREIITIANYYANGEDAILMLKEFRF